MYAFSFFLILSVYNYFWFQLCAMIEADINHSHFTETDDLRYNILGTSSTKRGQLVTYDHFLAEYWPHFPQHISKNFRSSLFLFSLPFTYIACVSSIVNLQWIYWFVICQAPPVIYLESPQVWFQVRKGQYEPPAILTTTPTRTYHHVCNPHSLSAAMRCTSCSCLI